MYRAALPARRSVLALLQAWLLPAVLAAGPVWADAPGVHPDRVVFGQSAKLSGTGGTQLGRQYRDGALLAFGEANRAGGVHGRRIDLVSLDDRIDRDQAVANTRSLIDEHRVFALTHYTFTQPVKAALPLAQAAGLPFVAPYTGYPELYERTPANVFVMRAGFDDELKTIVRHIETVGYRQVGVVFYANALGQEFRDDVAAKLQAIGRPLAGQGSMPLNAKDPLAAAGPAAEALQQACPGVVILGVSGRDAAAVVRRMGQTRCPVPRYFARGLVDISLLQAELGAAARGIMVTQVVPNPFRSGHPLVRSYRSLLVQRSPDAVPDFVEFEGYIAGRFIVQALRRCGPQLDRTCFVRALETERLEGPDHYRLAFGAGRRLGSRFVNIVMLSEDGRITD